MIVTEILKLSPKQFLPEDLHKPAEILRNGGVVAFPTDTVYGLAIVDKNKQSRESLNLLKKREKDQSLITLLPDRSSVFRYVSSMPLLAERLTKIYWPGPLTVIIKDRKDEYSSFRVPGFPMTRELLRQISDPVLATSANFTGEPETYTAEEVEKSFQGKIDLILDGGACPLKLASSVVYFEKSKYKLLREGDVTLNMIEKQRDYKILFVCTGNICRSPMSMMMMQTLLLKRYQLDSLSELEEAGFQIDSAGLAALEEQPMSRKAQKALLELNYPLFGHQAQNITKKLIQECKWVYAATKAHYAELLQSYPEFTAKIQLLGSEDLEDPYGASQEIYIQCARKIERYVKQIVEKLCD